MRGNACAADLYRTDRLEFAAGYKCYSDAFYTCKSKHYGGGPRRPTRFWTIEVNEVSFHVLQT